MSRPKKDSKHPYRHYEQTGVYGDAEKFEQSQMRFDRLMGLANAIIKKSDNVLDIGCGSGYFLGKMHARLPVASYYGSDISQKAIEQARETYKNFTFVCENTEQHISFPDKYFNAVFASEVVEHLVDIDGFIENVHRVLKPDGHLIISTPNLTSWLNRGLLMSGLWPLYHEPSYRRNIPIIQLKTFEMPKSSIPTAGHLRLFNIPMLRKLFALYGFSVIKTYGIPYLNNRLIKPIDRVFSMTPMFASGLVVMLQKRR